MTEALRRTAEPKASRVRVWQACDRILRSGRRPTVEGVRELLGGGSPNAVTSYINDWYADLGTRLLATETPLAGIPPEAISLMTELWRLATIQSRGADPRDVEAVATRMLEAERDAFAAEAKALRTLNKELQRQRSSAEQSLAETRALLSRREAALEEERLRNAELGEALVQVRLKLEVAEERRKLAQVSRAATSRAQPARKASTSGRPRRVRGQPPRGRTPQRKASKGPPPKTRKAGKAARPRAGRRR
jgi:hypothetical protein